MHYNYNTSGMMQPQMHMVQNNQQFNGMHPQMGGGVGFQQFYHENGIVNNNRSYADNLGYQQGNFQVQQHMPQYSMIQSKQQQHHQQMGERNVGRARAQTRGPFSRTVASRSTTPTPMNRTRNSKSKEFFPNEEIGMLCRSSEYSELNRNPSLSQIENNNFNCEYSNYNGYQDFPQTPTVEGRSEQISKLNIMNPDQIMVQKMNAPLEPTPTHVARMNKMKLMGLLNNNNTFMPQMTPTSSGKNHFGMRDNHLISRQSSFPPHYQEKYPPKSTSNSNNTPAAFKDSSPKVLGSYVSRQLEEEVTRLRYLVDTQTKKISALEMRNKELENELLSNRNYQQMYQNLLEKTNLSNQNEDENKTEDNEEQVINESFDERDHTEPECNVQKQKAAANEVKYLRQSTEKGASLFSNIHQFSAESALRKAGVPPGKPSYVYRPPGNAEMIDIKLAEFHNSRSSLIRWSKVSNTIYLFGTTQVQLRISRGNLLAKPESSEWGNGSFWPIEKFVSVFEPIERAKMPNN
ncbi:uncharacterized protein cubi_00014 [Cryptosporidium ubiquitum]|uniref:Uncharacterized protein n=1 Tax=Cryptosporidium ubiquitum TaxID=857276 RepID=A0A1J4MNL2_9CRYT|nr:uncharacterized protein cubi_00014 [Cryptosporidium ubiquitum]OII74461.1 hypothetical protein cubi_00014 [Cryptosporidium ubiquitum]